MRRITPALLVVLAACGAAPSLVDSGEDLDSGTDAQVAFDAGGEPDAAVSDSGSPPVDAGSPDASVDAGADASVDAGSPDASVDAGPPPDAGMPIDAGTSVPDAGGHWRSSLAECWTDATCRRVMAVGHGGAWTTTIPYNSNGALAAAYANGLDGVKIDVRITSDNVPVIAHSSPIELFESIDCYNRRIENMTAAQVTGCHRVPSTTETFQRLDDVLNYLRGKMVVQLCVKVASNLPRIVQQVIASNAQDFAFMEIDTVDLQTRVPAITGGNTVWYLINVASNVSEVDTLLNVINNPRAFMYEFDTTVPLGNLVSARLHPAGIRAFTYDSGATVSTQSFVNYYTAGYDVVSANATTTLVPARQQVNTSRGVSPP